MTLSLYYFFYKVQACLIVIIFTCFCLSSPSSFSFFLSHFLLPPLSLFSFTLSISLPSFYFILLFPLSLHLPITTLSLLYLNYPFFLVLFSLSLVPPPPPLPPSLSSFSFFSPFLLNCSIYSQLIFHHFLFVWHPVCSHGQYSWDNSPPTALFDYHASHSPSPEQMNLIELSSYLHPRATFHEGTGIHLKHCLMLASPAAIFLTCYLDKAVSLLTLSQIVTLVYW